jgi:hypothetical protein
MAQFIFFLDGKIHSKKLPPPNYFCRVCDHYQKLKRRCQSKKIEHLRADATARRSSTCLQRNENNPKFNLTLSRFKNCCVFVIICCLMDSDFVLFFHLSNYPIVICCPNGHHVYFPNESCPGENCPDDPFPTRTFTDYSFI